VSQRQTLGNLNRKNRNMTDHTVALPPGAIVDSLRVDRVLGQGAFAITYLVTDEVIGRSFALKEYLPAKHVRRDESGTVLPASDNPEFDFSAGLETFLQEGRTVAPLEHPNIVKVFRCFEANGTAYLLMPWYKGEPLHELIKRSGTFGPEEVDALKTPLLSALAYIHDRGVIHQDIKPSNIYITEAGDPILLDFGAAAVTDANHTTAELRLGSEGYAAPEQSGHGTAIGAWTDIYGFAATLYRCITGKIPPPASQRLQNRAGKAADSLVPISQIAGIAQKPAVVEAIENGLNPDPKKRPQSVRDWQTQFTRSVRSRGRASVTAGSPAPELAGIEREGREWLPIILGSVFALVVIAMAVYLFTGQKPDREIDPAQSQVDGAQPPAAVTDPDIAREKLRWEQALEADTVFAYRQFLEDYPESLFKSQAITQINSLDDKAWKAAEAEGTRESIETYLETFPDGLHEPEAMIRLDEINQAEALAQKELAALASQEETDWQNAHAARTIAALNKYIATWPSGQHIDEAYELKRQLESDALDVQAYQAARKLNTIEAYRDYIKAFPQGSKLASALEAIDALTLRPGKTFLDCDECPTMMVVPAGSFWQGSDDASPLAVGKEKPRRKISFAEDFAVSVYEITLAQWDQCVDDNGCKISPRDNGWGRANRPVIMVSWNDAQEYVDWINKKTGQTYRLPSESEWEYFARAGEEGDWLGGDPSRVCEFGNIAGAETDFRWQHDDCSDGAMAETLPAGSYKPNAFGLYDVIGNVAEWTLDCMNLSYLDAPADGSAWNRGMCNSRMTRGGSWFTGSREVRLPARFNLQTGDRNDFTGFRLVRTVEDQ
jgi:formylglycine-generating enzyme required for sulfatase activity